MAAPVARESEQMNASRILNNILRILGSMNSAIEICKLKRVFKQ